MGDIVARSWRPGLDAGAAVPGPIEEHHLSGRRQLRQVPLDVVLAPLPIVGGRQSDVWCAARVEMLTGPLDGATLAGGISSLDDLSLLVSRRLPTDMLVALPLGATCGAAILLAFGRPNRRPTLSAIRTALGDAGLDVVAVHAAKVDARGSTPYFATLTDGPGLQIECSAN